MNQHIQEAQHIQNRTEGKKRQRQKDRVKKTVADHSHNGMQSLILIQEEINNSVILQGDFKALPSIIDIILVTSC